MKLRTFLTTALATAAALAFTAPAALAQTAYKSEYRMSLVLGPAFPWGKGGSSGQGCGEEGAQFHGVSLL